MTPQAVLKKNALQTESISETSDTPKANVSLVVTVGGDNVTVCLLCFISTLEFRDVF